MEKKSFHHGGTIFPPRMEQYFLHGGTIYHQVSFPLTIGRLNEKCGVCKEKVKTEVNKRGFFSF